MIRFRLSELMADKGFREGRRIEIGELAIATGIHRSTLSRMINIRGANVTSANLDLLCRFFDCSLGEIAEYVPDEQLTVNAGAGKPKEGGAAAKRPAKSRVPLSSLARKVPARPTSKPTK